MSLLLNLFGDVDPGLVKVPDSVGMKSLFLIILKVVISRSVIVIEVPGKWVGDVVDVGSIKGGRES